MRLPDEVWSMTYDLFIVILSVDVLHCSEGPMACPIPGARESQTPSTFLISVKTDGPGATRGKVAHKLLFFFLHLYSLRKQISRLLPLQEL